jgi:hypothetical protein
MKNYLIPAFFGIAILTACGNNHSVTTEVTASPDSAVPSPTVTMIDGVKMTITYGSPTPEQAAAEANEAAEPTDTPEPTGTPMALSKREFKNTVDLSVTAQRISGNPYKFVGKNVSLYCTVGKIDEAFEFNATCGANDSDDGVNIVIEANSTTLEEGQSIHVLGTVLTPSQGTNDYGGEMDFPTVQSYFME